MTSPADQALTEARRALNSGPGGSTAYLQTWTPINALWDGDLIPLERRELLLALAGVPRELWTRYALRVWRDLPQDIRRAVQGVVLEIDSEICATRNGGNHG